MTRRVKQVTTARRVEIEEDTGHYNNLLLKTSLEEVEAVRNGIRKAFKIEPTDKISGLAQWS